MINKSRLIITSVISIVLVSILFLGSTYSIFTSQEIDEDVHVYKTGNLDITYTLSESNIMIENNFLVAEEDAYRIKPYRITITNTGNVAYQFDLILSNTPSSNTINYQYIKTKVGKLESKRLSGCTNNIIKEDVILLPGKSVDIDVRVWVSNDIANSEMGKTFYAKLSVDGLAIYNDNQEIDNSMLASPLIYLNSVEPGKYVKYTGTNGCEGIHCEGYNANYVDNSNKGFCNNEYYKFNVNGWRVGYIKDDSAHLVSAGATDCMCTSSNGEPSSSSCIGYLSSSNINMQFNNMDNIALKYCNKAYAKGGVCNNTTAWAMNASDFERITKKALNSSSCYATSSEACGKNDTLIDNGGFYWYATPYSNSSNGTFGWYPSNRDVRINYSDFLIGVRPVLALESSIIVTGGEGTEDDPYIISNQTEDAVYLNTAAVGSYVKYVGDSKNGCDDTNAVNGWTSCGGKNANYVSDSNKGYCHSSSYPFNINGWRIGYIENGNVHLISAGATDCMCTSSDGTVSSISCSSGLSTADYYKQIDNLDNLALKYCNKDYVKGGICNNSTVWAMDDLDFQKITGNDIANTCYTQSNTACGIGNDLIDNGSYYHLAKQNGTVGANYMWNPYSPANIYHSYGSNNYIAGMRPVISLASTVRITGGTGTYTDPYLITN